MIEALTVAGSWMVHSCPRRGRCRCQRLPPLPARQYRVAVRNDVSTKRLILNVIGKSNGVGLARDINLLSAALADCGYDVRVTRIDRDQAGQRRSLWAQLSIQCKLLWLRVQRHAMPAIDVNLMLEHVWPQQLPYARCNVAVPNPEWFDSHDLRMLRHVDVVWAKTDYTLQLFRSRHCTTAYVGFDSEDRYDGTVARKRNFFHLAGKSSMKGTDRLLRVWARHPEWPVLTVIQHADAGHASEVAAANIDRRVGYLDDNELRSLQNASVFHICTSLTEGWGHYIVEALSVGAVTITVDAAPMNELVTAERGMLVPYCRTGKQRLATTCFFDEAQFEAAIVRALALTDSQCRSFGENARRWYLQNKQMFSQRLRTAVEALPIPKSLDPVRARQVI